ncbi:MAG: UDP-N-acetylmuramate dehydrogenase [Coriobacteriia bacterium]|nr:UDP-N-acetylmuramate dehydrogenase [Coriobacteriia bacterium]MBS5477975.1 UDP-N-acetylmuramate dehydrogenase [Coriobacteriia bacterium]
MKTTSNAPLAPLTTLHVGGSATTLIETSSTDELIAVVRDAEKAGKPLFVLGAGSNVLICDDGFVGTVVRPRQAAIELLSETGPDSAHEALVHCEAGARWDDVVAFCVEHDLAGIEALSGIPGLMGSATMQDIGAYGQEMGDALVSAELLDRATGDVRSWGHDELGLGYRTSMLRRSLEGEDGNERSWFPTPRWVVLGVTLGLSRKAGAAVNHAQLAQALGVEVGAILPIAQIRAAVLDVRGAKAMLEDGAGCTACGEAGPDYDRWSSGSFFMNPVLTQAQADRLPSDAPRYPAPEGRVKTSAAWLIEHAGFSKGFGARDEDSKARLSSKHCLALTNRGDATADDVMELARTVRCGVFDTFGILLSPETVLVGESI